MNIIMKLRTEKNISQQKLAELCCVHQTAVSQWENGRTEPDRNSLTLLAKAFGVSV
jgi:transcriptional regulator with XRE-family HTH domain